MWFAVGALIGIVAGWLCAFFYWPTEPYARLAFWLKRDK